MKGTIAAEGEDGHKKINKKLAFKNKAPFRLCKSKINNTFIGNAEDLDIAMSVYNLLEYSYNYSIVSGSLSNCYRDEINDDANKNVTNMINNNKAIIDKSDKINKEHVKW